jgi:hypothetical protein
MAGGLLQLIAYGAQDIYLTNDPQITFFKVVYRRHTNFSLQTFEKTFNDAPDFGKKSKVKLYRLGDLATKMYLRVILNKITGTKGIKFAWIRRIGHAMIRQIDIEIGGNIIDRHYGTWLDIWYELARQGKHDNGYDKLIGDTDELTKYNDSDKPEYILYIPLQFWFNRHWGLALPLISIQYHDIYINVEFEKKDKLIVRCDTFNNFSDVKIIEVGLVTDYVYLDMDERKRFSVIAHEYLIEQVQYYGDESLEESPKRLLLDFKHPTKELIWAMRNGNYITGKKFLCYSNKEDWTAEILECSKLILYQSMILLKGPTYGFDSAGNRIIIEPGTPPPDFGKWEEFEPGVFKLLSSNGNFEVTNQSQINSLWININSLTIGDYSITDKINAIIFVTDTNLITIEDIKSGILDRDISFPVDLITDTRLSKSEDVCVYQFSNYGLFITGKWNPLSYALLEYNGNNRVEKRDGRFFGDLQPYMHHSNTPINGINLYSFAVEPEKLQPTGTSNLSKIENIVLTLWFDDTSNPNKILPPLEILSLDSRLFIYGFSYNIFRIISGLTGLSYND